MLCVLKVGPKDGYVPPPGDAKAKGSGKGGKGEPGGEWSDVRPADGRKVITNKPRDEFGDPR